MNNTKLAGLSIALIFVFGIPTIYAIFVGSFMNRFPLFLFTSLLTLLGFILLVICIEDDEKEAGDKT
jgi:ABC-type transport system involved in multi-copper enzyme maturation permease subunit